MRSLVIAVAVTGAFICPCLDLTPHVRAEQSTRVAEDTTFYEVPLACPAVRGLGCGIKAKPVLLDLQKRPTVEEAWLDQAGELVAVVWKRGTNSTTRQATIEAVTKTHAVSMNELEADARTQALTQFRSGTGWHRGADVDRLSEREARVLSDRLMTRVLAKSPSVEPKKSVVGPALTDAIRTLLVNGCTSVSLCRDTLLGVARKHLDKTELASLREALEQGFQAVGHER